METIFFQITRDDTNYVPLLKPVLGGKANIAINNTENFETVTEVVLRARVRGTNKIATTSQKLLKLLVNDPDRTSTIADWQGSMISKYDCEFLIVPPVEHVVTVSYGKHLYERYFNKFIKPSRWLQIPAFEWELFEPQKAASLLQLYKRADFISCDIETVRNHPDRVISCIGFTGIFIDGANDSYTAKTIVVPFVDAFYLAFVRTILGLPNPKVFQGGQYDHAYLLRYGAPTTNYAFDTLNLFHSWYSELPKRLDFITAYLLRGWEFWKDESNTNDPMVYYGYNAKDAFTTAMCLLALLQEMPSWAMNNYQMEFPIVFPCLLSELTGIAADLQQFKKLRDGTPSEPGLTQQLAARLAKLQTMVGQPGYNPNSPKQTLELFKILGCQDILSTGVQQRDKVSARHPLNKRLMGGIKGVREDSKLVTTYFVEEKIWQKRWLYRISPSGTDTGRCASSESAYWCGLEIQNIPIRREDIKFKSVFIADDGFYMGEADGEQAEARDTAYLSGDINLINTVEGDKDYHGVNASRFFGVPYEKIIGPNGEQLDKILRNDIGKRINHGANYNMGPGVLLDTMGIENVVKAKITLKLPASWGLLRVCAHLLSLYDEAYPDVRNLEDGWYAKCVSDVINTRFLVGPFGWHRYCFGDPKKNKHWLNAYVAHPPQNNNAMRLNLAYNLVLYNVWLPNPRDFKLGPQIHDSILFQYRIGRVDLALKVKEIMEAQTVIVRDPKGIERLLRVPVAVKGENRCWANLKKIPAPH